MRVHAIRTGNVLVKTAFLSSPPAAGGVVPYLFGVFADRQRVTIPIMTWVIEHDDGVIIVDTGENAHTPGNFITQSRFDVTPEQEIGVQLRQLGIEPREVTKVVLTHLHGDHIDGLKDFTGVPVWIHRREYAPVTARGFSLAKLGVHLPDGFAPTLFDLEPDASLPFGARFPLTRDGKVFAVPTPGHTGGHVSVIVEDGDLCIVLAGDVTYNQQALLDQRLQGPVLAVDAGRQTLRRMLDYTQSKPAVYLPSHDPDGPRRLAEKKVVGR